MPLPVVYFWNKVPFVRLLLALIAGIVLQWQSQLPLLLWIIASAISLTVITIYFFISLKSKFIAGSVNGVAINFLVLSMGALLIWFHDIRNSKNWIGKEAFDKGCMVVTIEEPLVEKAGSFKSLATINGVYKEKSFQKKEGQLILYFKKSASLKQLHYGSQIAFKKPLQEIKNTGNPGSFDYKRYCLFQGITHQVNLLPEEFEVLSTQNKNAFQQFIYNCRSWVVEKLRQFISGQKEQGLAEALLIGYKDDLDKGLVQSYTNTGVVHIIAISGMHLALIYGLLLFLTKPLKRKKRWQVLRIILILSGLWLFSLLAGAQASVVRSAVMFTCIVFAEALSKRTSVYNTLALSAFLLLAYNPFWLWDVGFQLSYAAVLSIVGFYKPVYHWFYFSHPLLDFVWKTMAISIAAQILTTPISLYHFHQFPVLFLITNLIAVPLSSLILFGEIAICIFSWLLPFAKLLGNFTRFFIYEMNRYIERMESISFSVWKGLSINIAQTILLTIAVVSICFWLMEKRKPMLWTFLTSLFLFMVLRSFSFTEAYHQRKLVVYNVPKYRAIDLIDGRNYNFIGDSFLLFDEFTRNFHLQPSRVLHRIESLPLLPVDCKNFRFCDKHILIIDSANAFPPRQNKDSIDVLVLSKNPRLYISNLAETFFIHQIIIDGSVPLWKARLWKHDCDSLRIPCFDVSEKGAFVMNLN